jgi:hypothetical protein
VVFIELHFLNLTSLTSLASLTSQTSLTSLTGLKTQVGAIWKTMAVTRCRTLFSPKGSSGL